MAKAGESKYKYWVAVLYPENMRSDWTDVIGDVLQLPYAYAIHDRDRDSKSEHRKDHVHVIVVFPNTTTYNNALSVFGRLSAKGKKALNTCEPVINIRHMYDYLIHDTETCEKQGKERYDESERITGNNFDIGMYEQLSSSEKTAMLNELAEFISDHEIANFALFYKEAKAHFDERYLEIINSYSAFLERLTRGNYQVALARERLRGKD